MYTTLGEEAEEKGDARAGWWIGRREIVASGEVSGAYRVVCM